MKYIYSETSQDPMAKTFEISMQANEHSLISKISPKNAASIQLQNSFLQKSCKSGVSTRAMNYYKQEIAKLKKEIKKLEEENNGLLKKIQIFLDSEFKIKNEAEKRIQKYRKRGLKIQKRLEILEKEQENTASQKTFLEELIKDYKIKVKKMGKSLHEAEKGNQELTEKIMDFIQREQDLMATNEQLMKKCRKMRSRSPKKRSKKSSSSKIKVWREVTNPKTEESNDLKSNERFQSRKEEEKKTSKFSLSSLFGRK